MIFDYPQWPVKEDRISKGSAGDKSKQICDSFLESQGLHFDYGQTVVVAFLHPNRHLWQQPLQLEFCKTWAHYRLRQVIRPEDAGVSGFIPNYPPQKQSLDDFLVASLPAGSAPAFLNFFEAFNTG